MSQEFFMNDGVFIMQHVFPKAGDTAPQHSHEYDHTSMLATGSLTVWCDGELVGDYIAPTGINILAGTKHLFKALEDNTTIYCVHNTHGMPRELLEETLIREFYEPH